MNKFRKRPLKNPPRDQCKMCGTKLNRTYSIASGGLCQRCRKIATRNMLYQQCSNNNLPGMRPHAIN